jgi:hypothetical protein
MCEEDSGTKLLRRHPHPHEKAILRGTSNEWGYSAEEAPRRGRCLPSPIFCISAVARSLPSKRLEIGSGEMNPQPLRQMCGNITLCGEDAFELPSIFLRP